MAWISRTLAPVEALSGFQTLPDPGSSLDYAAAIQPLAHSSLILPMQLPAYMEMELPNIKTWWYRKEVTKRKGKAWLKLPVGLARAELYLNGRPVDLAPYAISGESDRAARPAPGRVGRA